ncbi:hypothetical protein AB0D33_08325 [Streptomyces sp. NPDC048404]|uniref:hypothetical protein n=1 Tax=unclassified Streptomyces TaxID=2593676 RepID=UPI0034385009
MHDPLWLALLAVGVLGVRLARPPWWLVVVLLLGGYLVAGSFLAPSIGLVLK